MDRIMVVVFAVRTELAVVQAAVGDFDSLERHQHLSEWDTHT